MISRFGISALGPLHHHVRCLSSASTSTVKSFFDLFPKSFPSGGPPKDPFQVSPKGLRREYRGLQSENHPDILIGSSILNAANNESESTSTSTIPNASFSTVINRAYTTLRNPYSRIAHIIELYHPQNVDITQDETAKALIAKFQSSSPESSLEYKDMLLTVLEAHESLELAESESELEGLSQENDARINTSEENIDKLLKQEWPPSNWDDLMMQAVRLKYWVNIQNGIKEWEPGKPVHLTH